VGACHVVEDEAWLGEEVDENGGAGGSALGPAKQQLLRGRRHWRFRIV
jgi:hypothetical protein